MGCEFRLGEAEPRECDGVEEEEVQEEDAQEDGPIWVVGKGTELLEEEGEASQALHKLPKVLECK